MTEAWFRDPGDYIRELVEAGEYLVAWDRGYLVKRKIDPIKHAELYYGSSYPWRVLVIGEQGSAEYRQGDEEEKPTAVYPTWKYGEEQDLLEELVTMPVGEDEDICNDRSVKGHERPVLGQEHRVIVTDLPDMRTGPGRAFMVYLKTLQEDNPNCIIHLHGSYSFRSCFGMGFGAADFEPRTSAQKGKVFLPNGTLEIFEATQRHPSWVTMLGFKPVDLKVPRNRCIYNIKSVAWAGEHYRDDLRYAMRAPSGHEVDTTTPRAEHEAPEAGKAIIGNAKGGPGDKFQCDTCSLSDQCKYFRTGAVCSVPGAEPKDLASMFKTRDADTIIDGLGTLVAANARRLDRGMAEETALGDINPEVSRLTGQVFDQGVKLAKLLDPNLRGGARVQVNVGNGGAAQVAVANPKLMVAAVFRELEGRGIPREQITPEMVQNLLAGMADSEGARRSIEGSRVIDQTGREVD